MKSGKNIVNDLLTVIIALVLFVVILILVVFAAVSYQTAVGLSDAAGEKRAVISYVATAVKSDQADSVTIEKLGDVTAVVIQDEDAGYEQRIYHAADGRVLNDYGEIGSGLDPDNALTIGTVDMFEVSFVADDLLEVETEIGCSCISIR